MSSRFEQEYSRANDRIHPRQDLYKELETKDLVVIDLNRPNMQPLHDIPNNLVYAGSKENVRLTMVNGKILYENGEFFIGEAPEAIYARANALVREMMG